MLVRFSFCILLIQFGCRGQTFEDRASLTKPTDEGEVVPGYISQSEESVAAGSAKTVKLDQSVVFVGEGALNEDAAVRLRTLNAIPDREELVSLGESLGDILEVTFFEEESRTVFASSVLNSPYQLEQTLSGLENDENLKYLILANPEQEGQPIYVAEREAITLSESGSALMQLQRVAALSLQLTSVITFAVEMQEVPAGLITITGSLNEIVNEGGAVVSDATQEQSNQGSINSLAPDLAAVEAQTLIQGVEVSEGRGKSPLASAASNTDAGDSGVVLVSAE